MMKHVTVPAMLFLLCLPLSCTDLGTEPSVRGIVWNRSIDGVRLGDDSSTVIRKLGPASSMAIGDFVGYSLVYSSGPHAGVIVTISTGLTSWGLGVNSISVVAPYQGRTPDGIGLQSTREQVRAVLGPPTPGFDAWDWYIEQQRRTIVGYDSSHVTAITLTFPLPS